MTKSRFYVRRSVSRLAILAASMYVVIAGGLYAELSGGRTGVRFESDSYLPLSVLIGGLVLYSVASPKDKELADWWWLVPLFMVIIVAPSLYFTYMLRYKTI